MPTSYELSVPVVRSQERADGAFLLQGDVLGTAFPIGGEYMLTAAHVAREATGVPDSAGLVALYDPSRGWVSARIVEAELLEPDVAILQVKYLTAGADRLTTPLPWDLSSLPALSTVRSCGYAHGMHRSSGKGVILSRAFQGYVVCRITAFLPPGMSTAPFSVYELSFLAPRGLSGAPVWSDGEPSLVRGMVIGNSEERMLVFHSSEKLDASGEVRTYEQYNALTFGIATEVKVLAPLTSRLLRGTIAEHLARHQLLHGA